MMNQGDSIKVTLEERPKRANAAKRFWAEDLQFSAREVVWEYTSPYFVEARGRPGLNTRIFRAFRFTDEEINAFNSSLENLRLSFHNQVVRIAVQIDGPRFGDTRRLLITPGAGTAPVSARKSFGVGAPAGRAFRTILRFSVLLCDM